MLFLTRFYTEGITGTVIDAYAAGILVVASEWENFSELIDNSIIGIGYRILDRNGLFDILSDIADNLSHILDMKQNCLLKALEFQPENGIEELRKDFFKLIIIMM